jgi:hypothetical protein
MPSEVHFKNIKSIIIKELDEAKHSVDIAVAWITDREIIEAISNSVQRNITVRILSYDDKINGLTNFKKLYHKGASIRLSSKLMHNKFCVIDSDKIISGSFNWTNNASYNKENITIFRDDNKLILDFQNEFKSLWDNCKSVEDRLNTNNKTLNDLNESFENLLKICESKKYPLIYLVENEITNTCINGFKSTVLKKGFYLIKNNDESFNSLKYIHYVVNNINVKELNLTTDLSLELNIDYYSEFLSPNLKKTFDYIIKPKNDFWLISENKAIHFNSHGDVIGNTKLIIRKLNDRLLFLDEGGHKILKYDCQVIVLQADQKVNDFNSKDILAIKKVQFINDSYFLALINIDSESNLQNYCLYDWNGNSLTRPIFKKFLFGDITLNNDQMNIGKNYYDGSEYPVLFKIRQGDTIQPYNLIKDTGLWSRSDKVVVFKNVRFEHSNTNITYSQVKVKATKDNSEYAKARSWYYKTDDLDTYYFYSDKEFGHYFIALNILQESLSESQFSNGKQQFKKETQGINDNNTRIKIAKRILSNLIDQEKEDKQRIEKKKMESAMLEIQQNKDKCYIATCVYGGLNHPHTIEFRKFRDEFLNDFFFGRLFIKIYYSLSPKFVEFIEDKPNFKKKSKYVVEKIRLKLVKKIIK